MITIKLKTLLNNFSHFFITYYHIIYFISKPLKCNFIGSYQLLINKCELKSVKDKTIGAFFYKVVKGIEFTCLKM